MNWSPYVAAGGNYLLNVGPDPDGVIPLPACERLLQIGQWMRRTARRSTAPSACCPDWWDYFSGGRITTNGNDAYLILATMDADRCALAQPTAQRRAPRHPAGNGPGADGAPRRTPPAASRVCRPCRRHCPSTSSSSNSTALPRRSSTTESWCAMHAFPDQYNPVWTSMSRNSGESMPCGGHDIGLNVWVEPDAARPRATCSSTSIAPAALTRTTRCSSWGACGCALTPDPVHARHAVSPGAEATPWLCRDRGRRAGRCTIAVWVEVERPVIHVEGRGGSRRHIGGELRELAAGHTHDSLRAPPSLRKLGELPRHGDDRTGQRGVQRRCRVLLSPQPQRPAAL